MSFVLSPANCEKCGSTLRASYRDRRQAKLPMHGFVLLIAGFLLTMISVPTLFFLATSVMEATQGWWGLRRFEMKELAQCSGFCTVPISLLPGYVGWRYFHRLAKGMLIPCRRCGFVRWCSIREAYGGESGILESQSRGDDAAEAEFDERDEPPPEEDRRPSTGTPEAIKRAQCEKCGQDLEATEHDRQRAWTPIYVHAILATGVLLTVVVLPVLFVAAVWHMGEVTDHWRLVRRDKRLLNGLVGVATIPISLVPGILGWRFARRYPKRIALSCRRCGYANVCSIREAYSGESETLAWLDPAADATDADFMERNEPPEDGIKPAK